MYKTNDIKLLRLKSTSSLIESEIFSKLVYLKKKNIQILSVYHPRKFGESTGASFSIVSKAIIEYPTLIFNYWLFVIKHKSKFKYF